MGIIFLSQLLKSLGLLSNNQEKISKGKKNPMECFHSEGIVAKMLMKTPPGSTISPCRVQLPGVSHFAFVSLAIGQRRDDGMNITRPYCGLSRVTGKKALKVTIGQPWPHQLSLPCF